MLNIKNLQQGEMYTFEFMDGNRTRGVYGGPTKVAPPLHVQTAAMRQGKRAARIDAIKITIDGADAVLAEQDVDVCYEGDCTDCGETKAKGNSKGKGHDGNKG